MASFIPSYISSSDQLSSSFSTADSLSIDDNVNDIYSQMLSRATGCANISSLTAPPLSTQFVKSSQNKRAYAGSEGALAEIKFPLPSTMIDRAHKKHNRDDLFGYVTTAAADIYPAGYGERSAMALEREDHIYQLKGTFISSSLAFSKLRARIEARNGDVASAERIFEAFWGLDETEANSIPHLHVAGSEHTRMAAMEDRAYHALSGHPAYTGGFRVDMATLAPDALGDNVPLNWGRIRTGLKTVANIQTNADIALSEIRQDSRLTEESKLYMDLAIGSQPAYHRGSTWEIVVDQLLRNGERSEIGKQIEQSFATTSDMLLQTYADQRYKAILDDPDLWISEDVSSIAKLVRAKSTIAMSKTVEMIKAFEHDRALIELEVEDEFDTFTESRLSKTFNIPRYKLTRESWYGGYKREELGKSKLPDVSSHGRPRKFLDLSEVRESNITAPISVSGALNMAVYFIAHRPSAAIPCYRLLREVRDPNPSGYGKVSGRLRDARLYRAQEVRNLGREIFGEEFRSVFETLLRNLSTPVTADEMYIKSEIWQYLSSRSTRIAKCPVSGGWRDLITYLITAEEGWTLYYWVRVAMGKTQHVMSTSILAPIMAGEPVDFLTLIIRGIRERAARWKAFYEAAYQKLEDDLGLPSKRHRLREKPESTSTELQQKYLPPHLRDRALVEARADKEGILNRQKGLGQDVYQKLVELQTKIKFFAQVKVVTNERRIAVGMSDEGLRELFIEFYQMRWYSLELRIQKAAKKGQVFFLGTHPFPVHPWGELRVDLPETLDEFLEWTQELDQRAWTRSPSWLLTKVKKSISELWDDVAKEIQAVLDYIEQVEDCLADEQTQALAQGRVDSVLQSLANIPAIQLPVQGYIAPPSLPERKTTLIEYANDIPTHHTITMTGEGFIDKNVQASTTVEEVPELMNFDFEEDDDDGVPFMMAKPVCSEYQEPVADNSRSLTYREIWNELRLEEASDERMKFALGISSTTDLDAEHFDAMIGPTVLYKDKEKTARMWKPRMGGIMKRLGKAVDFVHVDDM